MGFPADLSWLEDPQVFQVGRLDAHSDHCWFESEEDLKGKGKTNSVFERGVEICIQPPSGRQAGRVLSGDLR